MRFNEQSSYNYGVKNSVDICKLIVTVPAYSHYGLAVDSYAKATIAGQRSATTNYPRLITLENKSLRITLCLRDCPISLCENISNERPQIRRVRDSSQCQFNPSFSAYPIA